MTKRQKRENNERDKCKEGTGQYRPTVGTLAKAFQNGDGRTSQDDSRESEYVSVH